MPHLTQKGNRVYGEALRQGYIKERAFRDWAEVCSKEAEMVDKVVAFAQRKHAGGVARRRELGVEEDRGGSVSWNRKY